MQIKFKSRFFDELNEIKEFIAKDNELRAISFIDEIVKKCFELKSYPQAYRKSQKVNKPNARDLIHKGYVVPYLIDQDNILILGIYKANEWNK